LPSLDADRSQALLDGSARIPGVFDESADENGALRPHWLELARTLQTLGTSELTRRWEDARRTIRENGVTYNVYGDPEGLDRPWVLDPIPLIVAADEWKQLEAGLIQRAAVVDAALGDIYGSQSLLSQGVIPPEVVFANPGFLRPCHGSLPRGRSHLFLYAADLARSADGQWSVVADRAQTPSGAGYAIENRVLVSQLFRDAFLASDVARLAPFFQRLRDAAAGPASADGREPRVVLLSPGPYNETYFEHAYLARYLGHDLVEGADLTTRDNAIYWKTLGGLVPVDVILRRVDDDWCDPLELKPDSELGVAGLAQAVRAGRVRVANALGSGVLESPAWLELLPTICRELRSEELLLPSTPTWWCGFEQSRNFVLSNLRDLVLKPAFRSHRGGPADEPIFAEDLSESETDHVVARIRERPHQWVGQHRIDLATAPSWTGQRIEPRRFLLRAYVLVNDGVCTVMPGGLARISSSTDALVVSIQRGGGSKDVWVMSSEPLAHAPMLEAPAAAVELRRGGVRLPSRIASDLFWLGRYAERCEMATRLLRAILTRMSDESGLTATFDLVALLELLGADDAALARCVGGHEASASERAAAILALVLDDSGPTRLRTNLERLHQAAWRVRERLSNDAWRILNQLHDRLVAAETGGELPIARALETCNAILADLAAVSGLEAESMTRGHAWRFLDMGRRLERALGLSAQLAAGLGKVRDDEGAVLRALLEVADSSLTYRSRYRAAVQVAPVLDLLLVDETNPRSVGFQIAALNAIVDQLPREQRSPALSPEQRIAREAAARLRLADVEALALADEDGARVPLAELLADLVDQLPQVSDQLERRYFSPAAPSRQLGPAVSEPRGQP